MKYNKEHDRWVSKDGLVFRYDTKQDKLVLCKQSNLNGYCRCGVSNGKTVLVHRLVYETFIGSIPEGYVIDHINTIRDDNRLENLRCVTPKENNNNPLTIKHNSEALKGKTWSEFGEKFKKHYGIARYENIKLYNKEQMWYTRHNNKCSWE